MQIVQTIDEQFWLKRKKRMTRMVPPSPELQRRFTNTDQVVRSGRSYLIPDLVTNYPNDYVDLSTYESIRRIMQR